MVAFILIGVAAFAKAAAYIIDISVMGGIIACGVFLLIIASVGIVGTILHHQVTLFFVSFIVGRCTLVAVYVLTDWDVFNECNRVPVLFWSVQQLQNDSMAMTQFSTW